ncbi:MAG: strictosidine synthase [Mesorhizobium sp.]
MSNSLTRIWDALWGRGEYSITVPSMDGAMRPNVRLDDAAVALAAPGIDDLAAVDGALYFSQGEKLFALDGKGKESRLVKTCRAPISALAVSAGGELAIGFDTGGAVISSTVDSGDEVAIDLPQKDASPTAMSFVADGSLLICVGSAGRRASEWKRDLMTLSAAGTVWRVPASRARAEQIGQDMAFPAGIVADAAGMPVVSEAWKHRLVRRNANGTWETVLGDIPGYPGRLTRATSGQGYWLSVFAPRSQMIEFVLREKIYRERMIAEVPEDFWMAPSLRAGRSFKEPLQGGGVKHLGIHKPWGPTRSYGLLVRLDEEFKPVDSFHSRSDGKRHGVTSAVDWNGTTMVASKGDGVLVALATAGKQA